MSAPATLEQALACARRGWPVFPCQPGSKVPATRHGYLDATTDPERIERWWQRSPHANLAIATGAPGPDVLDVDQHGPAGNGFAALNQLIRGGFTQAASAIITTPGGGLHLYFTGSQQRCGKLPRHHLDFRARGGYVLAPPSQAAGAPYRVIRNRAVHHPGASPDPARSAHHQPANTAGLDWSEVTRLLDPARHATARPASTHHGDLGPLAAWVARQREGNRNDALFWAACRAAEAGDEATLAELASAGRLAGLTGREAGATIASARRTAGRQPPEHHAGREGTS